MNLQVTERQLSEYDEQGFTIIPNVFPIEELAAIDREIDHVVAEKKAKHKHNLDEYESRGWLFRLGLASSITRNVCQDERILDLIQDIVKPGIAIYSAKLVCKDPYDMTPCLWHQDDAYYTQHSEAATRLSIWMPLSDVSIEQGCLQVVPRSHKRGLQPASEKKNGLCNLSMDVEVDLSERIYVPVKAGSIIVFSALLWHASDGNQTDRQRRAFIVSYQEATAQGGNGPQWKILRPA